MDESVARPLIVVCAGGRASEVASYIRDLRAAGEPIFVQGYVDDHRFDSTFEGAPILGGIEQLGTFLAAHPTTEFSYVTAIGDNRARSELVRRIGELGASNLTPWTVRHPTACVGDGVQVGVGTCIAPSVVITTNAVIGDHCIVNVLSSISHDATLASFVHICPSVAIGAHVTIEEGGFVGAGATVTSGVWVGAWSVIAPGSVVTEDVPARVTVDGAPARIVKRHGRGLRQSVVSLR